MTPAEVQAIRERAAKATPGPWMRNGKTQQGWWRVDGTGHDGLDFFLHPAAIVPGGEDAAFIAAARSDVPALCDAVEALRAERDALRERLAMATRFHASPDVAVCLGDDGMWRVAAADADLVRWAFSLAWPTADAAFAALRGAK